MDKRAFATLAVTMFLSMLGFGLVIPLLPIYAKQLGASGLEIGLITAAFSISNILFLPVMGRLSDRLGRKIFLCSGLGMMTLIALGFIWAQSSLHLILLRAVQGFATSMHLPVAQAFMGDMTPEGQEGRWMGYFNAIMFAGLGTGPLFGGVINDLIDMRAVFIVTSVLMFLSLLATLVFIREPEKKEIHKQPRLSLAIIRRSSVIKGLLVLNVSVGVLFAVTMTFLPVLATVNLALSTSLVGIILSARTPVSMLQSITGRYADTHNRKVQIVAGNLAALVFMVLMPSCATFWGLLLANVFLAAGMTVAQPAATAYVVDEGRVYGMGATMALFMMAMQVGSGVGPIAIGSVIDHLGIPAGFYTGAAINVLAILFFVWTLRHHRGKRVVSEGGY
jgi:DHA1 family multidrug resistance protein-like MFS transporter